MSCGRPNTETEIKLRAPNAAAAAELLTTHGFSLAVSRVYERNSIFDTAQDVLKSSGRLIRLREAGDRKVLTFKGPASTGKHKSREEIEIDVSDAGKLEAILERLDYRRTFVYEKFRTEFTEEGDLGIATLDETPVGVFVELEGSADWIDTTASRLGFEEADYITSSYGRLYLEWCVARNLPSGNMVFDPA